MILGEGSAVIPSPIYGVWHLGPVPVRAYAICIIIGILVAVWLTERRWAQRGGKPRLVLDIACWAVPFGIVGGRLYHVVTSWQPYFGRDGHPINVYCYVSPMTGEHSQQIGWMALGPRADEARSSASAFLGNASRAVIDLAEFRNGYFPHQGADIKDWFEALRTRTSPDVILSHWRHDAHQDHREISRLTWNTFRDHTILEYEIAKWDGDAGQPNVYLPASRTVMERKTRLLQQHFGSQRAKDWFDNEVFMGLARLRGMECRAPEGFAEAFHARKLMME